MKYCVIKRTGNVIVQIMLNHVNNKYHFVNLTKGHICKCAFDDISDAVEDMEQQKQDGRIIDYFEIVSGK